MRVNKEEMAGLPKQKKNERPSDESVAMAKYLRVSPYKVRIMAKNIVGQPVDQAVNTLAFSPNKTAFLLLKVLRSALANAETSDRCTISDASQAVVYRVFVDGGPTLKRWHPRSQGRAYPILKRSSHITVVLKEAPVKGNK